MSDGTSRYLFEIIEWLSTKLNLFLESKILFNGIEASVGLLLEREFNLNRYISTDVWHSRN